MNNYIDWDEMSPEEYQSEEEFRAEVFRDRLVDEHKRTRHITPTCECQGSLVEQLKESIADLSKPFSGYIPVDESLEREIAEDEKYYWDAKHGLI